jgi:hypothetical protein
VLELQARVLQTLVGVRTPLLNPGTSALLMALDLAGDMWARRKRSRKEKERYVYF